MKETYNDTLICGVSAIAPNRFVGVDGLAGAGKQYGVTRFGADPGEVMDVAVFGIADVEVASGVTLAAGDTAKADAAGCAVKAAVGENGFIVKTGATGGELAEILLR